MNLNGLAWTFNNGDIFTLHNVQKSGLLASDFLLV
jgi:hypothetical protein